MNGISSSLYQIIIIMHTLFSGGLLMAILTDIFGYAGPISLPLKLIIGSLLVADLIFFPLVLRGAVRK